METIQNSRIICNICNIADASPVIHCSVCCNAFHYKCTFPDVPESTFYHLVNMPGMHWYCPADRNLRVSALLDRLSLMERKLMERPSSFDEIFRGTHANTQSVEPQVSPALEPSTTRKILRASKRIAAASNEVIPKKRSKAPKKISNTPPPTEATGQSCISAVISPIDVIAISERPVDSVQPPQMTAPVDVILPNPANVILPNPAENSEPTTKTQLSVVSPRPKNQLPVASGQRPSENLLVVVPPTRSIFLSRLGTETSVDDIKNYISEKLSITSGFGLRKFDPHGAQFASFLLRCDDSIYEPLVNSKNWPKNMRVEKFFQRRSRQKQQN